MSVELLDPSGGTEEFHVDAGLRIRGGFSRSGNNPKHALRLFFRGEHGDDKLRYPLFGEEGVDEFDKVDLRTSQNYSWAFQGNSNNTFVREVFSRDVQGQMEQPYTRSRYYHLYLNGQYFGLFQTQERAEADYAESYLGGDSSDYDVIKQSSGGIEATDGDTAAYNRLWQATNDGFTTTAAYYEVQGMNPDGTRNLAYERLLDVDNLIDYMIITYYTGDRDGPGSRFTQPRPNNFYGIYNRENPDGFKWMEHDSEHSLGRGENDMVNPLTLEHPGFDANRFSYFNPHWLHEALARDSEEYRTRFADRVHKYFDNDGLLTPDAATSVIDARAAVVDTAIVAESARWGDSKRTVPYDKDDWLNAVQQVRDWISNRNQTVIDQFKGRGWYPDTSSTQMTVNGSPQLGGSIAATDLVGLFTNDTINNQVLLGRGSEWKYLDDGSNQGTAWRQSSFNDSSWQSGNAQLGYGDGDGDEATVVSFGPNSNDKFRTTYFRKTFNVTNPSQFAEATILLQRDDGAVVYLNGTEVARSNMPGGTITHTTQAASVTGGGDESTFFNFSLDPDLLVSGSNTIAVEVHQVSGTSSDISFDLELLGGSIAGGGDSIYYTTDGADPRDIGGAISGSATLFDGNAFTLPESTLIRARAFVGGEWGPIVDATFFVSTPASAANLRIAELNYNPQDPRDGEADSEGADFEFVELQNISNETIDLAGVQFTDGIDFTFSLQTLDAGERTVVVRNRPAFESRYGSGRNIASGFNPVNGEDEFDGKLSNGGERIEIVDRNGIVIQAFEYDDGGSWPGRADGNGSSLEIIDTAGDYEDSENWQSSIDFDGSPSEVGSTEDNSIIVNEVLAHTDLPLVDSIELHNTTGSAVDISGWFLSDSNDDYFKFAIPNGTILPAGGYIVFDEDDFQSWLWSEPL